MQRNGNDIRRQFFLHWQVIDEKKSYKNIKKNFACNVYKMYLQNPVIVEQGSQSLEGLSFLAKYKRFPKREH